MSASDTEPEADAWLKPLSATDGEPAFAEPWQAEALAMADTLVKQGVFTAPAWSAVLGEKLRQAERDGKPDTSMTYYEAVLAALETLIPRHSPITPADMRGKRRDWEAAYIATPHGQPVVLKR